MLDSTVFENLDYCSISGVYLNDRDIDVLDNLQLINKENISEILKIFPKKIIDTNFQQKKDVIYSLITHVPKLNRFSFSDIRTILDGLIDYVWTNNRELEMELKSIKNTILEELSKKDSYFNLIRKRRLYQLLGAYSIIDIPLLESTYIPLCSLDDIIKETKYIKEDTVVEMPNGILGKLTKTMIESSTYLYKIHGPIHKDVRMFDDIDNWYSATCDNCWGIIQNYRTSVRRPTKDGWVGCYCSWECVGKNNKQVNLHSLVYHKIGIYIHKETMVLDFKELSKLKTSYPKLCISEMYKLIRD